MPLDIPQDLLGTWPFRIRDILARNLEALFVFFTVLFVLAIFYLFPYKIAFLNLFYLPALTAAYFMEKQKALLGCVFCILLVIFAGIIEPGWFTVGSTQLDIMVLICTWGCFLILASAGVASLQQRLSKGFQETRRLYEELKKGRVAEEMKEKVERALYATMDPVVAKLATEGKLRFEKRDISIMFTDLTGFTTYSDQHSAEVVLDELNRFLGNVEPVVEMFHGHLDKYMGDGIMVEFGAPTDYSRHALMAVLAGWKTQEKMKTLNVPWNMRVGIATGPTIVGMFGVRRQSYSALGDRVIVAKRLEEICASGQIYIDEPTFIAVEPFIDATRLRKMGFGRQKDKELFEEIAVLEEKLAAEGESYELLYKIGRLYYELRDATAAIHCFEKALILDPNSMELRLAYADANLKKDEFEKIQLKGKLHKIAVYEVTGIKNRWHNPAVIPQSLSGQYAKVEERIQLPVDLVLSIEAIDGSIGHGHLVGMFSYAIADRLMLNDELKKTILQAGYLQNIGKEAVPQYILNNPVGLGDQEARLMEKYVLESVATLKRLGYIDPQLLEIVRHHRENWDGTGFPDRLKREGIPIGARITAISQAYSALTSWRPYHEPWNVRTALGEIRKDMERGIYDPTVFDALLKTIDFSSQ